MSGESGLAARWVDPVGGQGELGLEGWPRGCRDMSGGSGLAARCVALVGGLGELGFTWVDRR